MAITEVVEETGLDWLPARQFAGQCATACSTEPAGASSSASRNRCAEAGIAVVRVAFERWTAGKC
jgi:hypothetical protein